MRVSALEEAEIDIPLAEFASKMNAAFTLILEPEIVRSPSNGKTYVQFILPSANKLNLDLFINSRLAFDKQTWEEKLLHHSWLMDLGVMMPEPAIRFEGMAGECLWGCACWIVVPYDQLRGDAVVPTNRRDTLEAGIAEMTKTVVSIPSDAATVRAI